MYERGLAPNDYLFDAVRAEDAPDLRDRTSSSSSALCMKRLFASARTIFSIASPCNVLINWVNAIWSMSFFESCAGVQLRVEQLLTLQNYLTARL